MHAAVVTAWGGSPKYTRVPITAPEPDGVPVKVMCSGLHIVVRSIASGNHYASGDLPYTPGVDGIGRRLADNKLVYFISFPGGAYQEILNVERRKMVELPNGIDPYQVAGYANPALSSWMALRARTKELPENFTVLVMGATSASGKVAVEVARVLGAGKVIGVSRNAATLSEVGVDEMIILDDNVSSTDCSAAAGVDVILDYLYGPVAQHVLSTVNFTRPVQYIHIGGLAGTEMMLPGHVLRSKDITIRGAGPGSWSREAMRPEIPKILNAFKTFKTQNVKVVPLSEIEEHWHNKNERIVFTP
ncbi:quinone oxidoreductase [Aureobasidium melanogenum CBS 110374]|uniref:Quinone oxidoreductase n=1 Tax=Aureobasidium melanogenum (strain CBS 110374) TaxID=1043003 RepID=A0A074WST6_AURM1|nr:quinone oxidoreductase [Aureobasidium melanogenum CBS 110374]KEQ65471.1 quinone oxidoreductase [Aureobasidium melanogenum CBS 110374]